MERANEAGRTLVLMAGDENESRVIRLMHEAGLECEACPDAQSLAHRLLDPQAEIGAVIASRWALQAGGREVIDRLQQREPTWSTLPVVLFAPADHVEPPLRNVVLLQEPVSSQELITVMKVALGFRARQRELRSLHERLERLALADSLTGLPNRSALHQRLVELQRERRSNEATFTAVFVDLDDFKRVNDTYGHVAGDEALRQIARHLERGVRSGDFIARFSGDEFVVLLVGVDSAKRAAEAAQRLSQGIEVQLPTRAESVRISASAGIFHHIDGDATPDAILAQADTHMYEQKRSKWRGRSSS